MILFTFVKRALKQLDRRATDNLSYQQLSRLEPRLLEDIGLKLENGRVVDLNPAASSAADLPAKTCSKQPKPSDLSVSLAPEPQGGDG